MSSRVGGGQDDEEGDAMALTPNASVWERVLSFAPRAEHDEVGPTVPLYQGARRVGVTVLTSAPSRGRQREKRALRSRKSGAAVQPRG